MVAYSNSTFICVDWSARRSQFYWGRAFYLYIVLMLSTDEVNRYENRSGKTVAVVGKNEVKARTFR